MGESTLVNDPSFVKTRQNVHPIRLGVDVWFLGAVAALVILGFFMVFSTTWALAVRQGISIYYYVGRQAMWTLFGLALAVTAFFVDYRKIKTLWVVLLMFAALGLLVLVLLIGDENYGSIRSLFGGSLRPSELAKLAIIIYLSYWFTSKKDVLGENAFGLYPLVFILGVTSSLILAQPDISAGATVYLLGIILFILAKGKFTQIFWVILLAAAASVPLFLIFPQIRERFVDYFNGLKNLENASPHLLLAFQAIAHGGLFGVGLGNGTIKDSVPVPWTDSIFAVMVEELGLLIVCGVIVLYLIILWRGIRLAERTSDPLGKYLAAGLTIWIVLEAFINMAVIVNLIPFAGNSLPFISQGGSSLVACLVAVGMIMNVARNSNRAEESTERSNYGAVINLRRRDGRRRVSRPVRR